MLFHILCRRGDGTAKVHVYARDEQIVAEGILERPEACGLGRLAAGRGHAITAFEVGAGQRETDPAVGAGDEDVELLGHRRECVARV